MFKSVIVGTDGSDTAREAVRRAADVARTHDATLHLVHVRRAGPSASMLVGDGVMAGVVPVDRVELEEISQKNAAEIVDAAAKEAAEAGVVVERHILTGDPATVLLDLAAAVGADVIVVGSKGMTGAKRFLLGSVPNRIAHHATCDVLIVRTC